MKTILLYVHDDAGAEARLQAALALARAHSGHIACLQVTPLDVYVATDIFGGAFVMPSLIDKVNEHARKLRADTEARLVGEGVSWSFEHCDGPPAPVIVSRASLADVVVLSRGIRMPKGNEPEPLAGEVALHVSTPVLAVPPGDKGFDACGTAVVAWNGSVEAANALKAALPMLRQANAIKLVTIREDDELTFPATDGCEYLARHGLKAELHEIARHDRSVGDRLLATVADLGADYLVMGAFGHSRARELILGGVSRWMLIESPVPLVLAH